MSVQLTYRSMHSMKTAILHAISDSYDSVNSLKVTLLVLLDLSTSFDCVDHAIGLNFSLLDYARFFISVALP